jgi:hypothetical protein
MQNFVNKHSADPEILQGRKKDEKINGLELKQYQCKTNTLIWFLI